MDKKRKIKELLNLFSKEEKRGEKFGITSEEFKKERYDLFPVRSEERLLKARRSMERAKQKQLNAIADITGMNAEEVKEYTSKKIIGFQIPCWDEVLDLAERALRHVDGINFVGWDICVTEDGPVLIEGNSTPSFIDIQLFYGGREHEGEGQRYRYIDLLEDPDKWRRV